MPREGRAPHAACIAIPPSDALRSVHFDPGA